MKSINSKVLPFFKIIWCGVFAFFVGLIFFTSGISIVNASESTSFSVSPLNPETNQPQSTYYNLTLSPKEHKDLTIRIFNSSPSATTVNVNANTASTNSNGVIAYIGNTKNDSTLKIPFANISKVDNSKVTIPGNGSTDVKIHITMPDKKFNGEILGGIRVTSAKSDSSNNNTSGKSPAVTANIAYSIAVLIKENNNTLKPSMHVLSVQPESRDSRNFISATLQNSSARVVKKLSVTEKVYKKGSGKLLYKLIQHDMQMAPNSKFNLGIDLQDKMLESGDYSMKIHGNADGVPFSFEKGFTITNKQANNLNENSVYYTPDDSPFLMWIYILIGILVALILVIAYWYWRKKHKKLENK